MEARSFLSPKTLFVSRETLLLSTRIAVLKRFGLVVFPSDLREAPTLLRDIAFDVLVLCNSLLPKEKREFIAQFKSRSPAGRVVSVSSVSSDQVEADIQLDAPVTQKQWKAVCRALKTGSSLPSL